MKRLCFVGGLIPIVACSQSLVGHMLPPAPAGLVAEQGACVAYDLGNERECDYSIGFLDAIDGTTKYVYGARLERRNDTGKPTYRITDDFPVPELQPGAQLMYFNCESNNRHDYRIVAVVQIEGMVARQPNVIWAKRFDLAAERFVDIPAKDVACFLEGLEA